MAENTYYEYEVLRMSRAQRLRIAHMRRIQNELRRKISKLEKKKMTGIPFFLMLMLALVKDFLDVFLSATFFLSILVFPLSLFISVVVLFYLKTQKVSFTMRKFAVAALVIIVESVPFLSILPTYSATFVLIRHFENKAIRERNNIKKRQVKSIQKQQRRFTNRMKKISRQELMRLRREQERLEREQLAA